MADFQQPLFSKRPPVSTLSKKSSISNGNGSVYSEVFGGPTKTYSAARIDDYAEIFSNYYAPKPPSTIPFLDFPESDGGDFLSHSFDYSEIFGVLDGSDFAVPYDDLFSNPPPDSRTPAEKDSHCQTAAVFSRVPSKEHNVDHLAHPEKNGSLSNGSSHHYDCAQQFNVSYNKANQGGKDDSITGITHIAQLHEVSGFTYVVDECNPSQMTRSDKCLPQSTCVLDINEGSKGKAAEGNHLKQATLYAPVCTSVIKASKDDLKEDKHQLESNAPVSGQHHIQHDGDKSFPGKVFLTVSEINLLTQPSQVPPPSRPPPRLFLKRGDSERMVDSNTRGYPDEVHVFKAPTNNRACIQRTVSEADAHEDAAKNSSLPCFDVEVDASSAAAASVAAMKDAMEKAEAKIRSAKQSMERKRDNFPNRTKLGVNEDRKVKERREGKIAQEHKTGELNQEICDVDNNKKLDFAVDQKHKTLKAAHIGPDEGYIELAKESIGKWQRKESKVTIESHKQGNEADKRNLQKHFCHPVKDDRFEVAQEVSVKANEHKLNEKHSVGIEEKVKKMARKEAFDWEENDGSLKATSKDVHEMMENKEMSNRAHEQEENEKKVNKVYEQEETELKLKVAREENEKRLKEACEREENEKRIKAAQEAREREENRKRLKAAQEAHEREENEKRKAAQEAREREENEKRIKAAQKAREQEENQKRLKAAQEAREREENEKRLKAAQEAREREENEKRLKEAQEAHEREENERRLKAAQEAHEREENEKRLKAAQKAREQEENEKRLRAAQEARKREEHEMRLKAAQEAHEREEHEKRLRAVQEAHEREEHEKKLKAEQEAREREEHEKQLKAEQEANEQEENERRLKAAQAACGQEENEKSLKESLEAREQEENERRSKQTQEACEKEGNEKRSKEAQDGHEREKHENLRASQETCEGKEDKKPLEAAQVSRAHEQEMKLRTAQEIAAHEENVKKLKTAEDAYDWQENEMKFEAAWDAYEQEENHDRPKADHEHVHEVEMKSEAGKEAQGCENHRKLEATKLLEEQRNSKNTLEAAQEVYVQNTSEQGENDKKLKPSQDPYEHEGNRMKLAGAKPEVNKSKLTATQRAFSEDGTVKKAAVENAHEQEENGKELKMTLETAGSEKVEKKMKAAEEVLQDGDSENLREAKKADGRQENERKTEASQSSIEPVQINQKIFLANAALDRGEHENNDREADVTLDSEEKKNHSRTAQAVFQWLENVRKLKEAQQAGMLEEKDNVVRTAPGFTLGQDVERKVKNAHDTGEIEQKERDRLQRERELEMERSRKIEEEREREREREKDRIAVERATREARDRAFTEARERAERVAVEKATTEARQRALTEARERVEKASAEAREKSIAEKASAEARLRAERAAVERATAEARERAAERAALEARERAERKGGIRQSSSFSDVRDFSHESQSRVEGESAKRSKARLERHQRTVERAAKALAEKNMRDILAQREQAERNRLAETLDADVRRWSNGKEGNLRALLSTLQYILGPDSGWQPIPLTDVITANAVKKAYRKATLCVHPDKVQQRGASIQQKYICEKVFDLLKEAWNKFNSEER